MRGVERKGRTLEGARVLVVGSGGVGSAIAASLAAAGVAEMALFDTSAASAEALAGRLRAHYPELAVTTGSKDPAGFDLIVNATPLGMKEGDPLPFDVDAHRALDLRRRSGDEERIHAAAARRRGTRAARCRSAPTCCSR